MCQLPCVAANTPPPSLYRQVVSRFLEVLFLFEVLKKEMQIGGYRMQRGKAALRSPVASF